MPTNGGYFLFNGVSQNLHTSYRLGTSRERLVRGKRGQWVRGAQVKLLALYSREKLLFPVVKEVGLGREPKHRLVVSSCVSFASAILSLCRAPLCPLPHWLQTRIHIFQGSPPRCPRHISAPSAVVSLTDLDFSSVLFSWTNEFYLVSLNQYMPSLLEVLLFGGEGLY